MRHEKTTTKASYSTATSYSPYQKLSSVFNINGSLGNKTLLQALFFKGDSFIEDEKELLMRAAVAALLDAAHTDVDYPLNPSQVIAIVNSALASGDSDRMLTLAKQLDIYNYPDVH